MKIIKWIFASIVIFIYWVFSWFDALDDLVNDFQEWRREKKGK